VYKSLEKGKRAG